VLDEIVGFLISKPGTELFHPGLERDAGLEAEDLASAGDVGEAVPDVAGTEGLPELRLDPDVELTCENVRHLQHRGGDTGSEIDGIAVAPARLERRRLADGH